jgi:hypothetical protein
VHLWFPNRAGVRRLAPEHAHGQPGRQSIQPGGFKYHTRLFCPGPLGRSSHPLRASASSAASRSTRARSAASASCSSALRRASAASLSAIRHHIQGRTTRRRNGAAPFCCGSWRHCGGQELAHRILLGGMFGSVLHDSGQLRRGCAERHEAPSVAPYRREEATSLADTANLLTSRATGAVRLPEPRQTPIGRWLVFMSPRGRGVLLRSPGRLSDDVGCEPLALKPAAASAASLLAGGTAEISTVGGPSNSWGGVSILSKIQTRMCGCLNRSHATGLLDPAPWDLKEAYPHGRNAAPAAYKSRQAARRAG